MTQTSCRGPAADTPAWNRSKHLPSGQVLYSNPNMSAWLAGKAVALRPEEPLSLSPQAEAAPWAPEALLSGLVDGDDIAPSDRYLSVSERVRRLFEIHYRLRAIRAGFIKPVRFYYAGGTPVRMANDGPTGFWRAWTEMVWATLPANDSDIFGRTASTEKPKNAHLAESLTPLLAWRKMSTPIFLDGTNWMQADNDNYPEGDEPASNLQRRIRPGSTDAELISYIQKAGPCTIRKHVRLGGGGAWELEPTDVTLQAVADKTDRAGKIKKSHSTIVRAGKLRIANGKTMDGDVHIAEGTILFQPDKFGELMGPEPDAIEKVRGASYWVSLFKVDRRTVVEVDEHGTERLRFIKAGRIRRKVLFTANDHAALLSGRRPPATKLPDGLPLGTDDIGAQFVGHWISNPKGRQPLERWQDVSDEMARQKEFERWAAALPADERKALKLASTAANFEEIGESFGKKAKTAERHGKRILIAANENLKKVMAA